MLQKLIKAFTYQRSLRAKLLSFLFFESEAIPLPLLIKMNAFRKPSYAYCLYYAALLAKRLDIPIISVIEFGVAGGNGLVIIEKLTDRILKDTGINFEIYGFDTGEGLPKYSNAKDLPYWFKPGLYGMDQKKLNSALKKSTLILGDVKETVKNFCAEKNPAPIACIFNDLDLYVSTKNSFELLKSSEEYFLPRVFCYFDDIVGTAWEMYGEVSGELLAIEEFNRSSQDKKIVKNQNLSCSATEIWHHEIYYLHNFKHPLYSKYIGCEEQEELDKALALKFA